MSVSLCFQPYFQSTYFSNHCQTCFKSTFHIMQPNIDELKNKILNGQQLSEAEAYSLLDVPKEQLLESAAQITKAFMPRRFDSCSIINARSGRCSENCKWCAQSAHHNTGCKTYPIVDHQECLRQARYNHQKGVRRFSLVASGKAVTGQALTQMCQMLSEIHNEGISTCASMGLLNRQQLQELYNTGTHRYHCNLETAPSHFKNLCTTHTIEDKLETIRQAREIGFEICSGGIIGMGETRRQRVEFALKLREATPVSIPINILSPIAGTPLENTAPISDDEILETIAIFRLIHPKVNLRFAGGRARLDDKTQIECMRVGISGGTIGDLLTTIGSTIEQDRERIERAGYEF